MHCGQCHIISISGIGNISKCAEFNFWSDPEAAYIVFAETKCPIYIYPWEPCLDNRISLPFNEWRMGVLASNNNPFTTLLDPIERKAYAAMTYWIPCDNFIACCFIDPRMIKKMKKWHVTVELSGNHTRGQMILDHGKQPGPENAYVIEEIDIDLFKKFMLWICGHVTEYET